MWSKSNTDNKIAVLETKFSNFENSMLKLESSMKELTLNIVSTNTQNQRHIDHMNKKSYESLVSLKSEVLGRIDNDYVLKTTHVADGVKAAKESDQKFKLALVEEKSEIIREIRVIMTVGAVIVMFFGWLFTNGFISVGKPNVTQQAEPITPTYAIHHTNDKVV